MKTSLFVVVFLFLSLCPESYAQTSPKRRVPQKKAQARQTGVVVDERLAVVRASPSLVARPLRRLKRGRVFVLSDPRQGDGVVFYRIALSSRTAGWLQAESLSVRGRPGEDVRLFRLINSSTGFEQVDRARIFLEWFPDSGLRPTVLLLVGDLMEEVSMKLSRDIRRRLRATEMSASGAPVYSFYMSSSSLDRYVRLGLGFVFNEETLRLHYDGRAWQEIVKRFPGRPEAVEAQRRLANLREKMGN